MIDKLKIFSFLIFLSFTGIIQSQSRLLINFNKGWQFRNQEDFPAIEEKMPFEFKNWETVCLPHTAKIEPLVVKKQWEGISWYKKDFKLGPLYKNKKIFVILDGVMQKAELWLNGKLLFTHVGGYLPFTIDITGEVNFAGENRIILKTDNRDNPEVPPGKPITSLDFCYYSGVYRNVRLLVTNLLHITDASKENLTASGGIKIWYPEVTKKKATIAAAVHLRNESANTNHFVVNYQIIDGKNKIIAQKTSKQQTIAAGKDVRVVEKINVENPKLWHPNHPDLYTLSVEVKEGEKVYDMVNTRIGIRKFEIKDDKFYINDEPLLLVGTNRHQEYPYIGNALSDNAQYRDAYKIKQAGFNIVRLSHYPQSPAFMDACDELGILTIDAIPGWQFVGNEAFKEHSYQNARELIRRDRNHASVAMWELSLNESEMPDNYMEQMNKIAREEFPETKLITCGWLDKYYDVFIPARQHAKPPYYWKNHRGERAVFTAEYGDWEYFAQDAGLNQAGYAGLKTDERTSRQLRGDGEKRLLQQAVNFQEAHNDNLRNPHLGDANWLMFDYNRGYSPDIESSGIMDLFRLPKFSYYFYRSQALPTLKIATYWDKKSDYRKIRVYSDCDEVSLFLNDKLIEKKKALKNTNSDALKNPPYIFALKNFEAGTLKAVGFKNGVKRAQDMIATPGTPYSIRLWYDKSNKPLKADGTDVVFVYAEICDKKGTTIPDAKNQIDFTVSNAGKLIGQNPINAEAGIAAILLQSKLNAKSPVIITAKSEGLKTTILKIETVK